MYEQEDARYMSGKQIELLEDAIIAYKEQRLPEKPFNLGDVVKLKSGGPNMTISEINSDNDITVVWFDYNDNIVNGWVFNSWVLELALAAEPEPDYSNLKVKKSFLMSDE